MIDREHEIVEAEDQVGPGDVGACVRGHALHMVAQAIAEIAGEAGLEWRQPGADSTAVARAQLADHVERIARDVGAVQAHAGAVGFESRERIDAKKGIAAEPLVPQGAVEQGETGTVGKGAAPGDRIGRQFAGQERLGDELGFHGRKLARGREPVIPGASFPAAPASPPSQKTHGVQGHQPAFAVASGVEGLNDANSGCTQVTG